MPLRQGLIFCYNAYMKRILAFDPTPESTALALRVRYKYLWKLIRDERFKTADYHCEICGSDRGKREWLDGHEVYSFDKPKVILLEKIVFICKHCHDAIHLERTRLVSGKEWVAEVEAHYCGVNGITSEEMKADYMAYCSQYSSIGKTHPKYECTMDYGNWTQKCAEINARRRAKGAKEITLETLRLERLREIEAFIAERQAREALEKKRMRKAVRDNRKDNR